MKRMGGWDWASAHCLEKIQEMLSRAIKDQEDLWNMLLESTSSPELQRQRSAASELQDDQAATTGQLPGDHQLTTLSMLAFDLEPSRQGQNFERKQQEQKQQLRPRKQQQRLRPGVDINKRGIPADGHRGWKKYGSKSIQNANFCRGYYKCSVKECNAKKSVQPTDEDPSVFQVTYTGTHTCSSTYPRRKTHRIASMQPAATAVPAASAPQEEEEECLEEEPQKKEEEKNREKRPTVDLTPFLSFLSDCIRESKADQTRSCSSKSIPEDDDSDGEDVFGRGSGINFAGSVTAGGMSDCRIVEEEEEEEEEEIIAAVVTTVPTEEENFLHDGDD
ncbi:unnamed protein product, partial [Sphagnum jensenii]